MIQKYLATLAVVVLAATFAVSHLQFVQRAALKAGETVEEHLQLVITVDDGQGAVFEVDPDLAQLLSKTGVHAEGSVRLQDAKLSIVPARVSWHEGRTRVTGAGAYVPVDLTWTTPADSPDGSDGRIYLDLPRIPGLEDNAISIRDGPYRRDDDGRYVIRDARAYRTALGLALARTYVALSLGVPLGIVLHAVGWYVLELRRARAEGIAALPTQGPGLPRTFYPDPIAEWRTGLVVLGLFSAVAVLAVWEWSGVISYSHVGWVLAIVTAGVAAATLAVRWTGNRVLTLQVEQQCISYARGRGEQLQWIKILRSDILYCQERSYRGQRWMELRFRDRSKLKIMETAVVEYPMLRSLLGGA